MAPAANHSHRAGRLKQSNKKNKRSNASKRSVSRRQGGKVQGLAGTRKGPKSNEAGSAKANRVNAAKQRRDTKRKDAWNARRGLVMGSAENGGATSVISPTLARAMSAAPPRVIGIISLSENEGPLEEKVRSSLVSGADNVLASGGSVTAAYGAHSKGGNPNITLLSNTSAFRPQYETKFGEEDSSIQGALDLCRVADAVLFLIDGSTVVTSSALSTVGGSNMDSDARSISGVSVKTSNTTAHLDHVVSGRGDRILAAIKAQGLPTPITVVVHSEDGLATDGGASLVGKHIGSDALDLEMADDDDDDEDDEFMEEMKDHGATSTIANRSAKSIRRSYIRRRTELKKYVSRLSATEFGENGKVAELDLPLEGTGESTMMEGDVSVATGATSTSTSTTASKSAQTSVKALVRTLCTAAASGPNWVADTPRPYLITDGSISSSKSSATNVTPPAVYDHATRELRLTGYIRGNSPWNCNQLVHVPHLGTFAVKDVRLAGAASGGGVELLPPIVAAGRKRRGGASNSEMAEGNGGGVVLAEADPEERESLEMFASPDALEGEQNLIGFDEDNDVNFDDDDMVKEGEKKDDGKFQPGTSRPAGWSDYQSAWLDALDPDAVEDEEDRGELAFALNKRSKPDDATNAAMDDDAEVDAEERRALLAARKKSRDDHLQFPDEVDHEEETSARDRYARYRALKSFRKSHWDPKENLPETYGAVYHFGSFRATQRDVLSEAKAMGDTVRRKGWGVNVGAGKDSDDIEMDADSDDEEEEAMARACVPPGAYVTITLEGVPQSAFAGISPEVLFCAVSLLPHENKVSVLHAGLASSSEPDCPSDEDGDGKDEITPVKSKDVLTFRCGWRTWRSRPIFSQHNLNSDKHKFERFMPQGGAFFAATVFGPATYAGCPVLMFRESEGSPAMGEAATSSSKRRELLAHGSMLGADADRIVLKRIVLTGYPTRVHKRHATVKYMFYNPEDVKWFMPAGITTKHGLQGNIVQSIGVHGVMKCLFNAPIKQHDTVCLPLYKRVYPKFAPEDEVKEQEGGSMSKHFRVL